MNKDYGKKAEELLKQPTYKTISSDPTTKYKNKLINRRLYPTGARSPKFYGLPKIHKEGTSLRPIFSSIGAVSYETSKALARILKSLVGKSPYHVQNTQDFIHHIQDIKLEEDQCIMSYDVKALFTSVPIQPAISIITKLLDKDPELQQRTSLSVNNITSLLEFCLKSTYFTFQGRYLEQQEGDAMGSPISPIVATFYMQDFEVKAINSSPQPHYLWKRFVDDTFTIMKSTQKTSFWNI